MFVFDDIVENAPLFRAVISSYWSLLLLVVACICLPTRLWSGLESKRQNVSRVGAKEAPLIAFWFPWLGNAVTFWIRFQDFLMDAR